MTIERTAKWGADSVQRLAVSYEEQLTTNPSDENALRELIILYWQCAEFGYWANTDLKRTFVRQAQTRLGELLRLAERARDPDCRFWARYIAWVDYGAPLESEECETLIREGSLDAALFLYSASSGTDYAVPAARLLESVGQQITVRERYILSVMEGIRKRQK